MDTPVTPAGSETPDSGTLTSPARPAPQHGVPVVPPAKVITPAPKPARKRPARKKAPTPAGSLHIDDMRARGLEYIGPPGAVAMPPKTGRVIPPETMDGPTAAYHVRTHEELAWLVNKELFRIPTKAQE